MAHRHGCLLIVDGWERSNGPVSSIILKRKCPDYDAVAEIKIIPLYEKAKRIGIIKVKDELLTYPEIKSMMNSLSVQHGMMTKKSGYFPS